MKNYKLQITVTKEILKKSMMCGVGCGFISSACAIANAVRDIFPDAGVTYHIGRPVIAYGYFRKYIKLPMECKEFMMSFDSLASTPKKRLDLPEITFEVEIPDEVIDKIDISNIYEGHPTLKLIPNPEFQKAIV